MKKLITILLMTFLVATTYAEAATVKFGAILDPIKSETSGLPEMVASKDQFNDLNLWETLDIDRDGFISKNEAAASKQIFDKWDSLDSNKDEKLDKVEFSKLFSGVIAK